MTLSGVTVSFRVKDADGEIFSMPLYGTADDASTITELIGEISNMGTLVDAILDGQVVAAGICIDIGLGAMTLKGSPVAGSEVERTGLIPFVVGSTGRTWSADLPAFKYADFLSGTNLINMAQTDVAAFTSALMTGGGHITWSDPTKGYNLPAVGQGTKTFRKHRRQTKRT